MVTNLFNCLLSVPSTISAGASLRLTVLEPQTPLDAQGSMLLALRRSDGGAWLPAIGGCDMLRRCRSLRKEWNKDGTIPKPLGQFN